MGRTDQTRCAEHFLCMIQKLIESGCAVVKLSPAIWFKWFIL